MHQPRSQRNSPSQPSSTGSEDSCALETIPGVAPKLAAIAEDAEKRQPPSDGTVVSIFMDYHGALRDELGAIGAARALIEEEQKEGPESEPSSGRPSVRDVDDEVARKLRGLPPAPAQTPPSPVKRKSVEAIFASAALLLVYLLLLCSALVAVPLVDAQIFGTALGLRFDSGSEAPPVAHGWIVALLIPLAIAAYIKMQGTGGRLRRLIDRLAGIAIPVALIGNGVFVSASIVYALSDQGYGPPPTIAEAAAQAASSWLASLAETIGTLGLAAVLGMATVIAFFAVHGILVRLRDLIQQLAEIWAELREALADRQRQRDRIVLNARAARIEALIAQAPVYVANRISDVVQPGLTANKAVYERLERDNGLPERQLALFKASIERLEAGSRPELLESTIRNALAPRRSRKTQRKKA